MSNCGYVLSHADLIAIIWGCLGTLAIIGATIGAIFLAKYLWGD